MAYRIFFVAQGFFGILNTFFKNFSRTIYEFFQDFSQLQKKEMALKAPSNTAKVLEPPLGPGQSPRKVPEIHYFVVPEKRLKIPIFSCVLQHRNTGQSN